MDKQEMCKLALDFALKRGAPLTEPVRVFIFAARKNAARTASPVSNANQE